MEELIAMFLMELAEKGIEIVIKSVTDVTGKVIYKIVHLFDSDGDGVFDGEDDLFTFQTLIPDLSDGLCLCNKGDEIGYGMPLMELVDGTDVSERFSDKLTGYENGFIVDMDNDGFFNDVLVPLEDFTGDGVMDWGLIVDNDNNGIPDLSPYSPFFPVGSDEFREIVYRESTDEHYTIMNKPISKYTVTEGILFIGFIVASFGLFRKIFRRKRVVNNGL